MSYANPPADVQRQSTLRRVLAQAEREERQAVAWETAANRTERLIIHGDDAAVLACLQHMVALARREAAMHRVEQGKHEDRVEGIRQRMAVQGGA